MNRSAIIKLLALGIGLAGCSSADPSDAPAIAQTTSATTAEPTISTTVGSIAEAPTTEAPTTQPPTTIAEPSIEAQFPQPAGPSELAASIAEAEDGLRSEARLGVRALWGERQQLLYELLESEPDVEAVFGLIEGPHGDAIALNYNARVALTALVNNYNISDTLPAWSIEPPLPAAELVELYQSAEAQTGIDWQYLAAINLVETRMGRINGVSTAGAIGPMQFLPTTWAECCEGDPKVPADAIRGAGEYLVDRGGPDDMDRAILGYNNSKNYVTAVQAYAEVLRQDPDAYYGYHAWQVYFQTTVGLVRLPVGYFQQTSVDAADWLAANPGNLIE